MCAARLGQQPGKIETALITECHVDEDDVRPYFGDKLHRFGGCAGYAKDALTLPLEVNARAISE
jgi:hypothetical protein